MKVEYRGIAVNREEEIWMALVSIKPSPDNSNYNVITHGRTTMGVWGFSNEAEVEALGCGMAKSGSVICYEE